MEHKKQDERNNQVPSCGQSHEQMPSLEIAIFGIEDECDVQHISTVDSVKSNENRHEERRKNSCSPVKMQRCSSITGR